jgi:hypothetical protein
MGQKLSLTDSSVKLRLPFDVSIISHEATQPQVPVSWLGIDCITGAGSVTHQPQWEAASVSSTDQGGNHARMSAQRSPQG